MLLLAERLAHRHVFLMSLISLRDVGISRSDPTDYTGPSIVTTQGEKSYRNISFNYQTISLTKYSINMI